MTSLGVHFRARFLRPSGRTARGTAASVLAAAALLLPDPASAQAPALRCDLQVKSTPGAGAGSACLDLAALQDGGAPIQTSGNATRIATDGFRLCKSAFQVSAPAGADVVFIYDNSGSMLTQFAQVDAAAGDTSFYHPGGCGRNPPTAGSVTYNTLTGPRTVQAVDTSADCDEYAGDPYNARGQVIAQGIAYLAQTSPNSTAGALAFSDAVAHARPPLPLSVPGNADLVKASVVLDTVGGTRYGPPLRQANAWLADTTLTRTTKRAIVFISDGEPNDVSGSGSYLNAVGPVPIFSIFLGATNSSFTRLRDMSARTGGQFYRVDPDNIAMMNQVMQRIIQTITVVNLPQAVEITNASWTPPMVSRSTDFVRNADSSVSLVLDSIVALKQGMNNLSVRIVMSDADVRTYPVGVKADGPAADSATAGLVCYEQPTLALLNAQGGVDSSYPADAVRYDVRLVRAASDIGQAVVAAVSRDTSRGPSWGDSETIVLTRSATTGGTTTNRREDYAFNGSVNAPSAGNDVLEAPPDGYVTLTWTHPRDPRETAAFTLAGRKIPVTPGFIEMVRVTDVPKGVVLSTPVSDPVVIRGGASVARNGEAVVLTHRGVLHNPHSLGEDVLNPESTPTFVFKTASPFAYKVAVYDNLGQFLSSQEGAVDSARWEQMRGNDDSLAVALSILPVTRKGQPFGTGVYILRATLTTLEAVRQDPGKPARVTPVTRMVMNRFGYRR